MPSPGNNNTGGERSSSGPGQYSRRHDTFLYKYRTEVAASMSSVLSTATAFPLDSVKTRMQTYKYSGFLDCVRQTYQTEKLRGFFRGTTTLNVIFLFRQWLTRRRCHCAHAQHYHSPNRVLLHLHQI
jgi:hypothetical protein